MKFLNALIIIVSTFLLVSCAEMGKRIETSSTTYHGEKHELRGTVKVAPIDATQSGSLEFKTVGDYLLSKLVQAGYTANDKNDDSEYIAYITYGIDNGKTTSTTVPIFGQTGGGTSYTNGTVSGGGRFATYNATTTTMPTYGVVDAIPIESTLYKRVVNIDVYHNESSKKFTKVYELRGTSVGSCSHINIVLNYIIDGMFLNFPGVNGETKKIPVPFNKEC